MNAYLALQEAGVLDGEGKLTDDAIDGADRAFKEGSVLSNPTVVQALTADGSSIKDWFKFKTKSITLSSG